MKTTSTFPLRLPRSIKEAVVKVSKKDGTSINQFIATAVAEKLAVMDAEQFFKSRQGRADLKGYNLEGFSVERLMRFATALEHDVVIEIRPRRKTAGTARVMVVGAA